MINRELYVRITKLCGIALAMWFAASAITTQLATRLALHAGVGASSVAHEGEDTEDDEPQEQDEEPVRIAGRERPQGEDSRRAAKRAAVAEQILGHNMFCPTCTEAPATGAEGDPAVASGERPSALALQLNATMVSSDPESSLATVYDRDYKNVAAISVGDEVRPGITIVAIATHRVYIQNGSQIEYIELGEQVPRGGADSASAKPSETRTATSGPASQPDAADDAIKCPSDNLCVVDRKFVDQTLANPAALMRQAAVRPHMNGGEVAGFQLSRIRSGSLPSKLGLKNGDVIAEVNGQAVTSLDGAMALYTKLRHASRLSVTIMRGGKYLSKEIQIQADIG